MSKLRRLSYFYATAEKNPQFPVDNFVFLSFVAYRLIVFWLKNLLTGIFIVTNNALNVVTIGEQLL